MARSAFRAWCYALVGLVALILLLDHLGVNAPGAIATGLHHLERWLDQPL